MKIKHTLISVLLFLSQIMIIGSEKPPCLMHHYSERITRRKSNTSELIALKPKRKGSFPRRKKSDKTLSKKESSKKKTIFVRKSKKEKTVNLLDEGYYSVLKDFKKFKKLCKEQMQKHPNAKLTELVEESDKAFFKREKLIEKMQVVLQSKDENTATHEEALLTYKVTIEALHCVLMHCKIWFLSYRSKFSPITYKILSRPYNGSHFFQDVEYM